MTDLGNHPEVHATMGTAFNRVSDILAAWRRHRSGNRAARGKSAIVADDDRLLVVHARVVSDGPATDR